MKERTLAALISYVVGKALGDEIDVPKGRLPSSRAQHPDFFEKKLRKFKNKNFTFSRKYKWRLSETLKLFRYNTVNTVERLRAVPCSIPPLDLGSNNVLKGTQDKFEIDENCQ